MSSILTLAKDLEQKSRTQANDTEQMLKTAFSEHEQSVKAALASSDAIIRLAIHDHSRNARRMVMKTWLYVLLTLFLVFAASGSLLWYLGERIRSNLEEIAQQKETLSTLNAKTLGVTYREDGKGRFLVLPVGMKAESQGWAMGEGKAKRNAIRLVKE